MLERKVLQVSIISTAFFALLGVVFGVISESSIIIFDGVYSLISVGLSSLSLLVLKHIESEKDDQRFPFGKAHFEPLLIVFKSLTLIGMCLFSATNAVSDLISGGREISPGPAIVYAIISTIGCILVTIYIQRKNTKCHSNLLSAEKNQWIGDSLLSLGVLLGFTASYSLTGSDLDWIVPYTDPGMVVIASCLFIFLPLRSFLVSSKEMLFCQVDEKLLAPIQYVARSISNEYEAEYKIRMISLGRELSIEVNFLLNPNITLSVSDMDRVRSLIASAANGMNKRHWININFTNSKQWL